MNRVVVPGEVLAEKPLRIDNSFVDGEKTVSSVLGMFDEQRMSLIPLEGLWYPRKGDSVIGVIDEARMSSYNVDLNAPYKGMIIAKFTKENLRRGDVVEALVRGIDDTKVVILSSPRRLSGGKVMDIKPSKVPRVIGKEKGMLKQLISGTKANIMVGMNGRIWIHGGDIKLATEAILKIEKEAHTSGLTERIRSMFPAGSAEEQTEQEGVPENKE